MAMAMNPIQVLRGGAEEEKEIDFKIIHYLENQMIFIIISKISNRNDYKNYLIIGLKSSKQAETARLSSFVGAIAIGDLVKSTLGPRGMDKILYAPKGQYGNGDPR